MALLEFHFRSQILQLNSSVNIVFSQKAKLQHGPTHRSPVLYLLHGLAGDHSDWLRKSSIERYVEDYDLVVVMPSVHRSFYANTKSGHRYFDFVSQELPQLCQAYLPILDERENTFVAGLSMGGYGAFKLALTQPDRFSHAASLSGALDLAALEEHRDDMLPEWESIFGPSFANSENDLLHLLSENVKRKTQLPQLFQSCGTEDYLYLANQSFRQHATKLDAPLHYEEAPGAHDWAYWDKHIQRVLEWLPLRKIETPEK